MARLSFRAGCGVPIRRHGARTRCSRRFPRPPRGAQSEATLITAIEMDPFVEGDRIVVRVPTQKGTEELDLAPFMTPVRPARTRVTPTPAPPAPGIRVNPRGVQGPAAEWKSSPARAIFHIPFRVDVGEEIAVLDTVTEHAGVIRLRGHKLSESERLAAPRLAVSRFDENG
jgi:hypothetical protein